MSLGRTLIMLLKINIFGLASEYYFSYNIGRKVSFKLTKVFAKLEFGKEVSL